MQQGNIWPSCQIQQPSCSRIFQWTSAQKHCSLHCLSLPCDPDLWVPLWVGANVFIEEFGHHQERMSKFPQMCGFLHGASQHSQQRFLAFPNIPLLLPPLLYSYWPLGLHPLREWYKQCQVCGDSFRDVSRASNPIALAAADEQEELLLCEHPVTHHFRVYWNVWYPLGLVNYSFHQPKQGQPIVRDDGRWSPKWWSGGHYFGCPWNISTTNSRGTLDQRSERVLIFYGNPNGFKHVPF